MKKHYFRRFEEARSACTLVITKLLFFTFYMVCLSPACAIESANIISVEYFKVEIIFYEIVELARLCLIFEV